MYESQAMQQAISRVFSNPTITEFTVTIRLTSSNASFSYSPLMIDEMKINQDFAMDFADDITVSFKATDSDYMQIFNNATGLKAIITFTFIDTTTSGGNAVYNPPPIVKNYNAILKNPQNRQAQVPRTNDKTFPMVTQTGSPNTPVTLQLADNFIYSARQQQFNGTLTNNTVLQAFGYIAQVYKVKKVYFVPPDNKNIFQHLSFPPGKDLSDIFDYLQDTYGCYNKGLDWYYTDDTLFIYPGLENKPTIPYIANIFNSFVGMYGGHKFYHNLQGNTISIVSNLKTKTKDLTHMSAENDGTSRTFLRSSRIIDNYTTTTNKGTVINTNASLMVNSPHTSPVVPNANNPKYQKSTDNIFKVNSNIALNQAVLMELGWQQSIPYSFKPGHKIKYFYDNNGVFSTSDGILEKATYEITKTVKLGVGQCYKSTSYLNIRLNPTPGLVNSSSSSTPTQ
jgi:hypothetical protein